MCGITGWVSFTRDLSGQRPVVAAMTETLRRRGPDAGDVWAGPHAVLGHRRLAVIDIEGGAQPMTAHTPDGPVVLTYSGEVYNYRELRAELVGRGHRFDTQSDTEVVLRSHLEWGPSAVERFDGMFAYAVWDGRAEQLVLVRDRLGIKPLFHQQLADGVVFGSEPKALLAHPESDRSVDVDGLRQLFMYTRPPGTAVWRGMHQVRPGTMVLVDAAGTRELTYWSPSAAVAADGREAAIDRVRTLLDRAVRGQLVSDVPLCTLLSGGLDSSAVTALAAAASPGTLRSISVDFANGDHFVADELRGSRDADFVRPVADRAGTDHRDVVLSAQRLADPELRREIVRARDLPMGLGDLDASLLLLGRGIREHSTVALSGESADEVFGGYTWFHSDAIRSVDMFPWYTAMQPDPEAAVELLHRGLAHDIGLTDYVHQCYADAVARTPDPAVDDPLERRMLRDTVLNLTHWLPYLLERKDRMSMTSGLEVRVPFCDHRLVEYVLSVPWALRTFDGREKSLLRAAVADLLPSSVLERRKSQYPTTQDPAYLADVRGQAEELLSQRSHGVFELVDPYWVDQVVKTDASALSMRDRHGVERLLDLAVWVEEYRPNLIA